MIDIVKMFNISYGFLKTISENWVKFRKTRNFKNRDNRGNRNGHMTKIWKKFLSGNYKLWCEFHVLTLNTTELILNLLAKK